MDKERSYYDILEVEKNASEHEIKKKWKKLVFKYHPDKLPEDKKEQGEAKIKELNEAYGVISDPEKRKIYDMFGKEGLEGHGNMGGMEGMGGMGGMEDILNQFMNQGRPKRSNVQPVQCVKRVELEDLYKGKTVEKTITRTSLCYKCEFTGFVDKKSHNCTQCNGKGFVFKHIQMGPGMVTRIQQACQGCRGKGVDNINSKKCNSCNGKKHVSEEYTVKFDIKPGTYHENIIVIENEGHEILPEKRGNCGGNERGRVEVIINEEDHPVFKRYININGMNPANLLIDFEIDLVDALCGFKKSFIHLDGRKLYITESEPIKDDYIKIIPDEGMFVKNSSYKKGCLYVRYKIKYPKELDIEQKEQIYKILTGKSYKEIIFSDDYKQVSTMDVEQFSKSYYSEDSDDDDDNGHPGVQCAQQ